MHSTCCCNKQTGKELPSCTVVSVWGTSCKILRSTFTLVAAVGFEPRPPKKTGVNNVSGTKTPGRKETNCTQRYKYERCELVSEHAGGNRRMIST